MCASLGIF
uniref:Uncharacterized protein n=1 Tax=Rhizophora mucronata TaxID=61149 RepID=A0A2P2QK96_RHIMU